MQKIRLITVLGCLLALNACASNCPVAVVAPPVAKAPPPPPSLMLAPDTGSFRLKLLQTLSE